MEESPSSPLEELRLLQEYKALAFKFGSIIYPKQMTQSYSLVNQVEQS